MLYLKKECSEGKMEKEQKIILKNASVVITMDDSNPVLYDTDIVISRKKIVSVGQNLQKPQEAQKIDCHGTLIVPGFINLHHHLCQILTRNVRQVAGSCLFDWLVTLYPVWAKMNPEILRIACLAAMGELLLSGCTTTVDHHYVFPDSSPEGLLEAEIESAKEIGIRFHPLRGSMSRGKSKGGLPPDSVVQDENKIIKDCMRIIEKFHDSSDFSMVRVGIAPCSPFSVTADLMKESALLARSYGVLLHTHLSETGDEIRYCREIYGMRPPALMEKVGWLGRDVSFAHCVHVDSSEISLFSHTQTGVAHCPSSNMRLGSGIAPVKEMIEAGVRVGLAVDGSASNDSSDFVSEMRNAMLVHRIRSGVNAVSHENILKMATVNSAEILKRHEIGRIATSMAADIAVFRIDDIPHVGAMNDPLGILLMLGNSRRAEYVICNGRIVVEKGNLTGINEHEVAREANDVSRRLLEGI
jgi:cytosine/adenosine deaminase-related metal-dependent hydrolase